MIDKILVNIYDYPNHRLGDYKCVITQMIFKDPVMCKTDINDKYPITYENKPIRKWLDENDNQCPIKREKIIIIEEDLQMKINVEKLINDNPELLGEQFVEEIMQSDVQSDMQSDMQLNVQYDIQSDMQTDVIYYVQFNNHMSNANNESSLNFRIFSPAISLQPYALPGDSTHWRRVRIHIFEPYFNSERITQTIGRGFRLSSHTPPPETQDRSPNFETQERLPNILSNTSLNRLLVANQHRQSSNNIITKNINRRPHHYKRNYR